MVFSSFQYINPPTIACAMGDSSQQALKKHYTTSPTKLPDTNNDDDDPAIPSVGPDLTSASELEYLIFKGSSPATDGDGEVSDDKLETTVARKVSPTYHNCIIYH